MRAEAASNVAEPRADEDNPWNEQRATLRDLGMPPASDDRRAEAYSEWANRMRDKQIRRQAADADPVPPATHWSTAAVFEESRRIEAEELTSRSNPWRVRNLLAVLDLREGATRDEIGSAYRKLAKQHHPDRFVEADEATKALHATRMRAIIEAYRALRDTQQA